MASCRRPYHGNNKRQAIHQGLIDSNPVTSRDDIAHRRHSSALVPEGRPERLSHHSDTMR
ncbi:hypothetical protein P9730_003151 [Raoultella ornithinolytica]|nr:hypothetical protein [Raoultella ornithinolytica]